MNNHIAGKTGQKSVKLTVNITEIVYEQFKLYAEHFGFSSLADAARNAIREEITRQDQLESGVGLKGIIDSHFEPGEIKVLKKLAYILTNNDRARVKLGLLHAKTERRYNP